MKIMKKNPSKLKNGEHKKKHLKFSSYWYLDVSLVFADASNADFNATFLKTQIVKAVKQIFGEAGAAAPVDIMKFNSSSRRAILRCPTESYVKLRSSLTLTAECGGCKCTFKVHKASSSLLSLVANSRTFVHTV